MVESLEEDGTFGKIVKVQLWHGWSTGKVSKLTV